MFSIHHEGQTFCIKRGGTYNVLFSRRGAVIPECCFLSLSRLSFKTVLSSLYFTYSSDPFGLIKNNSLASFPLIGSSR